MTCHECGADLPEGALFCGECGAAVELAEAGVGVAANARREGAGSSVPSLVSRPVPDAWERFAPTSEAEGGDGAYISDDDVEAVADIEDTDAEDAAVVDDAGEMAEPEEHVVDEVDAAEPDAQPTSDAEGAGDAESAREPEGESDGSIDLFDGLDDEPVAAEPTEAADDPTDDPTDDIEEPVDDSALCPQCDADVDPSDVFCGECGFLLRAVMPGPGDTAVIPPLRAQVPPPLVPGGAAPPPAWPIDVRDQPLEPPVALEPAPASDTVSEPEPEPEPAHAEADAEPTPDPEPTDDVDEADQPDQPDESDRHEQPADLPDPTPEDLPVDSVPFADAPVEPTGGRSRPAPDPFPWGADVSAEDLEATRIVSQHGTGERFVLQFSTGESVTVHGAGLIGRNPSAQPGEYVDQLVSIFDVGKSVSKTHLEFGQEGGRFWVSDRYSTNGSIVRQPEAEPRRCEPGRRYFVMRGTRIDVGEQFFVVS